jgi:formylglycine-generating enzyme required for sulfatase activity
MYSAASNSTALDRLGPNDPVKYSVFTRVLLPLLGRQDLTIQNLISELKHEVYTLAKRAGHDQRPAYYDGIYERFCLPGCVTSADKGSGITAQESPALGTDEKVQETKPSALAKVQPTPSVPIKPERHESATDREITGKDGAPMVLIPAGEFWMGSPDGEGYKDEHPRHRVSLDAFYMDKFEVTVARYLEFVRSTNRWRSPYADVGASRDFGKLPVVNVNWHDADAYCRWTGKRLPTEAEWEKAARGTDGLNYPWGNDAPTSRLANFDKELSTVYPQRLAPVESYDAGKSPYGLHHMAGNVWEWVADWYDENYYGQNASRNPAGPARGESRVLRGGSWASQPHYVRSALRLRNASTYRDDSFGFRCARDASQ